MYKKIKRGYKVSQRFDVVGQMRRKRETVYLETRSLAKMN